jgi:hypothetical protein
MERNSKAKKLKSKKSTIDFGANVDEAIKKAVDNALLTHKRAGVPIAIWRDEKVVLLEPEEIILEKN